jgi:hypothetical protein
MIKSISVVFTILLSAVLFTACSSNNNKVKEKKGFWSDKYCRLMKKNSECN